MSGAKDSVSTNVERRLKIIGSSAVFTPSDDLSGVDLVSKDVERLGSLFRWVEIDGS